MATLARALDLAVIGGTGVYQLAGLADVERVTLDTPYGATSDAIVAGRIGTARVAFLARHGEKHEIAPHRVNYRANVWALRELGARRLLGVNAVGGITAAMAPRAVVLPHQIIDYTHGRLDSYCDMPGTKVEHVDFSEPYSAGLRDAVLAAAQAERVALVDGGVYGATQGPRLETVAEIVRMARDGCDLVGMTGMPEAVLARELGLEYACVALVANWAAGCDEHGVGRPLPPISIEEIFEHLRVATAVVPRLIARLVG